MKLSTSESIVLISGFYLMDYKGEYANLDCSIICL